MRRSFLRAGLEWEKCSSGCKLSTRTVFFFFFHSSTSSSLPYRKVVVAGLWAVVRRPMHFPLNGCSSASAGLRAEPSCGCRCKLLQTLHTPRSGFILASAALSPSASKGNFCKPKPTLATSLCSQGQYNVKPFRMYHITPTVHHHRVMRSFSAGLAPFGGGGTDVKLLPHLEHYTPHLPLQACYVHEVSNSDSPALSSCTYA